MAATNINRVIISGNLTRDPELRATPSGASVCSLRVAVNSRRKDSQTGDWLDKPNYFDVKIWGPQGENCATYLVKGRPVAVDGRLDWREWEGQDGVKRQSVDIIADNVQFLGSPREAAPQSNGPSATNGADSEIQADTSDFDKVEAGAKSDDDIPF